MNSRDIIFALICGLSVSWLANDFFGKYFWIFFIVLPILSILGLWISEVIGKKFLFLHQAGKFVLAGTFADVVDIKIFQFLFLFAPLSIFFKAVSFLIATVIKYWANKHWAFKKHENGNINREIVQFFLVTLIVLTLDVVSFYYFGRIRVGLPVKMWQEASIILAALVAAVWNFCGYKFLVFKK